MPSFALKRAALGLSANGARLAIQARPNLLPMVTASHATSSTARGIEVTRAESMRFIAATKAFAQLQVTTPTPE